MQLIEGYTTGRQLAGWWYFLTNIHAFAVDDTVLLLKFRTADMCVILDSVIPRDLVPERVRARIGTLGRRQYGRHGGLGILLQIYLHSLSMVQYFSENTGCRLQRTGALELY